MSLGPKRNCTCSCDCNADLSRTIFVHHSLGKFSLPVSDAGGVGTAVPALVPPLADRAEEDHSCACTEAEFVLLNGQPFTGHSWAFQGDSGKRVTTKGSSNVVKIRSTSWGS